MIARRLSRPLSLVLLTGTALLGACSHAGDMAVPQPVTPQAAWTQPVDAAAAWPAADWWQGFNSPELLTLLGEARTANTDLAAAALRLRQAQLRQIQADASLLPSLGGSAGISRQESDRWGNGSGNDGTGSSSSGRTSASLGLSASYELDFWGRNRAGATSAAAATAISALDRETVALTVTADVANTYFQVLSLRDRRRSAEENLELAERVMSVVDSRYRNGAATALEVAQQRNALVSQQATIPALRQQELDATLNLAVLLGRQPQDIAVATDGLGGLGLPRTGTGVPADLLERRPDLKAASLQLVAAGADIVAARAALYPTTSISLSGNLSGGGLSSLVNAPLATANLGLSLAQSLFDGGSRRAGVEIAEARKLELVESYRASILTAFADVETALGAARNAETQRRLQEESVRLAREVFRLAETRYREGAVDLLTLLDAQRSLLSAQDQLTQTRLAELQAAIALFRSLGGGWA